MNLDDLCKLLVEHGLVDIEKFNPNFMERIMREGGVQVLRNQDIDVAANIKLFDKMIDSCIQQYSPEKVEVYFYLQELANHARALFYEGVSENSAGNEGEERRKFTDEDRNRLINRISELKPGSYKSGDIGTPLGLSSPCVGGFLSHLDEDERKDYRIRYIPNGREWEKY